MATENLNLETIQATDDIKTSMLDKMNSNFTKIDTAFNELKSSLLTKTKKTTLTAALDYFDSLVDANDATVTADKMFNGYTAYKGTAKITGTALATASTGSAAQLLNGQKLYNSSGTLITGTMTNKGGSSTAASGSISGDNYRLQIPTTGYYTTGSYLTRAKATVLTDLGVKPIPTINVTLSGDYTSYISGYGAGINSSGVLVIWAMSNSTAYEHIYFVNTSIGAGTIGDGWNISSYDTGDPSAVPHACTVTGLGSYSTINVTLNAYTINSSSDYVQINVTLTAS